MKSKFVEKCGGCIFWFPVQRSANDLIGAARRGDCFGAPPQVVPIIAQGQLTGGMNIRPQTSEDCIACSLYADEIGEVDGPANDAH